MEFQLLANAKKDVMIYFNNAATTWPKPELVYQTVDDCFRNMCSPDRTASHDGERSSATLQNCRREIADFFGIRDCGRLVLVPSCTYALNLAILGQHWSAGDVIVMSGLEHHAVSRPIRKVAREHGVEYEVAPYREGEPIDLDFVEAKFKTGRVRLLASTLASNVTGELLPSMELGAMCRHYGVPYLVDAAQAAGILPIDVEQLQCDMLAFAGHKGLFGPPGIGGLFVREGVELNTLAEGGTGKDSGKHAMSGRYPSNFEVGTHNLLGIVGVTAGVRWLRQQGVAEVRAHEMKLVGRFLEGLQDVPGVRVYGTPDVERRTAVVSITIDDMTPQDLADWLSHEHDVATRPGYHCAPLAHETIGTLPGDGTLRFSFGLFNTLEEVEAVLGILAKIPKTVCA
jgi:cysteine desulfurase family protein